MKTKNYPIGTTDGIPQTTDQRFHVVTIGNDDIQSRFKYGIVDLENPSIIALFSSYPDTDWINFSYDTDWINYVCESLNNRTFSPHEFVWSILWYLEGSN